MNRGFLILIILLIGCESAEWENLDLPVDTATEQDTETESTDPDCEYGDACNVIYDPICLGPEGHPFLRTEKGCICIDGNMHRVFEDQVCLTGCVENSNGVDYCLEDSP